MVWNLACRLQDGGENLYMPTREVWMVEQLNASTLASTSDASSRVATPSSRATIASSAADMMYFRAVRKV